MRSRFFVFFLLIPFFCFNQVLIKGTVYETKGVLEGAAVYLNNTMLGTTTNTKGEFQLPVKEGQYELIVSYLGYKKINYKLDTKTYGKPLVFVLEEEENVLDEIILKKTVYDDAWKYNLKTFIEEFIGVTELAKDCKILNPHVLHFQFDAKKNTLEAFARKPLKIKHKGLGYLITYELEHFVKNSKIVSYLGYSRYQQLKGGKRKQKKWRDNRKKTYLGSQEHFYKSVVNNTFAKEGYVVNQFKRIPNPERPTEEEIKKARKIIQLNRKNLVINFSKKISAPKTALDSAIVVLRKSRLVKFRDYLYKSNLKKEDILTINNNKLYLTFKDNLSVVYKNEKEELGYLQRQFLKRKKTPGFQTSGLVPIKKPLILDKRGVLEKPLNILYEGYWSYEKFANSLPLDYNP